MSDEPNAENEFDPIETSEFLAQELIDATGLPLVINFKFFQIYFLIKASHLMDLKRRIKQRYPAKRRNDAKAIVENAKELRGQIEKFNTKWGLEPTIDLRFAPGLAEFLSLSPPEDLERFIEAGHRAEAEMKRGLAVGFKVQVALASLDDTIEHFQTETGAAASQSKGFADFVGIGLAELFQRSFGERPDVKFHAVDGYSGSFLRFARAFLNFAEVEYSDASIAQALYRKA